MATISSIIRSIQDDSSLRLVAQTYSEIAVSKLGRIRGRIERNRKFVDEVARLYYIIKSVSPRNIEDILKKQKETVSVLLTSNYHFYGDLEEKLIKLFVAHTPEFPTDRLIIGKTGAEYLKGVTYTQKFDNLIFNDDLPKSDELANLIEKLKPYKRIFVYYSQFRSVLVQQPTFTDVTGEPALAAEGQKLALSYYIFEPDVVEMMRFIEGQIITLLLEQIVLEAELARTAARLTSMETAQRNADILLKDSRKSLGRVRRRVDNIRELEMIETLRARKFAQTYE